MSKNLHRTSWALRVLVAVILLQTLFFKFTGAPESVFIFEAVGMEPFGRYASGFAELVAAVLLLLPPARFAALGALLALGVISGAIFFHLTKLGIVVQDDGGMLFTLALVVLLGSAVTLYLNRGGLLEWKQRLLPGRTAR